MLRQMGPEITCAHFFLLVEKLMELEHHGMREGELSTMTVRSRWSPRASPGLSFTGTAKPGMWSQVTRHTMSTREALFECRKSRNRWGEFIVWNVQAGVMD